MQAHRFPSYGALAALPTCLLCVSLQRTLSSARSFRLSLLCLKEWDYKMAMIWFGFIALGVCWLLGIFLGDWGPLPQLLMLALFDMLVIRLSQRRRKTPLQRSISGHLDLSNK